MENLIEKVSPVIEEIGKNTTGEKEKEPEESLSANSVGITTPSSMPTVSSCRSSHSPFIPSLDEYLGLQPNANISVPQPQLASAFVSKPSEDANRAIDSTKIEKLRRLLVNMLPCQGDVDYLMDVSYGWWLIQRHMMPHLLDTSEQEFQNLFNVSTVSTSHPMIIARLLLCVAISIQQLPPNIDLQRLQTKAPLQELMDNIIDMVTATVISDDELVGTIDGVECLLLQTMYQVNAGNLRRAWLTFRRAINVAQLMGLHKISLKMPQESPESMESKRHVLWYQIMRGVCGYIISF
jgi:hypothetical protein